jgi:tRNA-Thr(GGU) m(6)t(6)A37 methyltransferase TsaA
MKFELKPVGIVRNNRKTIEDDQWGDVISTIELLEPFGEEALLNIESFSHVEVITLFDRVDPSKIETGARHPRNNPDWPLTGIFAQRGKNRPNQIGATICPLLRHEGRTITVKALDALDGTPVLDIKPVMREFLPAEEIKQPEWVGCLMKNYWEKK